MARAEPLLRFLSRIWIRLLAFNLLLVFLPAIGFLSLRTYEQTLLEQQERSMVQQGRILAAALGEPAAEEDAEEAREPTATNGTEPEEGTDETAPPLTAAEARRVLVNLRQEVDARLRVYGRDLELLADSSRLGPRREAGEAGEPAPPTAAVETRRNPLYRLGSLLYRLYARVLLPPQPPAPEGDLDAGAVRVRTRVLGEALAEGAYRAGTVPSPDARALIFYSALPVRRGEETVGVVLVSKSTFQILRALYDLRLDLFEILLASALAAIILSLVVATTIARPIQRLRRESQAILDRRGRLRRRFEESRRRDEIGDLARALSELTRRLQGHIGFIESFASDVSHEFKNPLAAIRNATEILAEVEDPAERRRFHALVERDIARLEHLLAGVREITRIDARLEAEPLEAVAPAAILRALVERYESTPGADVRYRLALPEETLTVDADPGRLTQAFENLLQNAASFSPPEGAVEVELEGRGNRAILAVRDRGPGIPEEHLERIFRRFFTYRPQQTGAGEGHTGLGLAIVKAIVEGYGGRVSARNREGGGAVFEVELPLASG